MLAIMKRFSIIFAMLFLSTAALAQKVDASFTLGASFASDLKQTFTAPAGPNVVTTIKMGHDVFLEGAVSVRVLNAHVASLHLEVPAAGLPAQLLKGPPVSGSPSGAIQNMSTVFVTPGLQLKLVPSAPISPWMSVGGGWARYSLEAAGGSVNKAALQYGGGVDFKTRLPLLGFRAEVRDFVTSDPASPLLNGPGVPDSGLNHHNILVGGGIVLRF